MSHIKHWHTHLQITKPYFYTFPTIFPILPCLLHIKQASILDTGENSATTTKNTETTGTKYCHAFVKLSVEGKKRK